MSEKKTQGEIIKCPIINCDKELKSNAGMTLHINMMHLTLSPTQVKQAYQSIKKIKKS